MALAVTREKTDQEKREDASLKFLAKIGVATLNERRKWKPEIIPHLKKGDFEISFWYKQTKPFTVMVNATPEENSNGVIKNRLIDMAVLIICCHFAEIMWDELDKYRSPFREVKRAAMKAHNPEICRFFMEFEQFYKDNGNFEQCQQYAAKLVKEIFGEPTEKDLMKIRKN